MPGASACEPRDRTLLPSVCGIMTIHFIDASEISMPAERGTRSCGVGNQRENARDIASVYIKDAERVPEDHMRELYPTHGKIVLCSASCGINRFQQLTEISIIASDRYFRVTGYIINPALFFLISGYVRPGVHLGFGVQKRNCLFVSYSENHALTFNSADYPRFKIHDIGKLPAG